MHCSASVLPVWLAALCAASVCAQRPETRLNTNPAGSAYSYYPQLAASGSNVYAAWLDDRDQTAALGKDVRFNRSLDGGSTWFASDVRLNTGPVGASRIDYFDIAAEGSSVCVAWIEQRNGQWGTFANRSLDGGLTWLATDVQVDTAPVGPRSLDITASGGTVYATWQDTRGSRDDIFFNRSLDQGATWLAADVRLDTDVAGSAWSWQPKVAAEGAAVYVTWSDDRNNLLRVGQDIYFNRSLDGGTTWLATDVRLDTNAPGAAQSMHPQIAVSGGTVHVVWQEHRNGSYTILAGTGPGDIYYNRSTDQGTTWLPQDRRISAGTAGGATRSYPSLAALDDDVAVAWEDARNGLQDIYCNRSIDAGATWLEAAKRLDTDAPGAHFSDGANVVLTSSFVGVLWCDRRYGVGVGEVFFNRSLDHGLTWLAADVRMNKGTSPGTIDALGTIAASGTRAYVAFRDARNAAASLDDFFTIPFGLVPYGAGKPGSSALVPALAGDGAATLGETVALDVQNAIGGATAALLVGGAKASLPLLGGTILVAPLIAPPVLLGGTAGAPGEGVLTLPLALPTDEVFVGLGLFFQVLVLDAGASGGVSMSNGVELWIG